MIAHYTPDVQVFDANSVVLSYKVGGELMQEVCPSAFNLTVFAGKFLSEPQIAVRMPFAFAAVTLPRKASLHFSNPQLLFFREPHVVDFLAAGKCRKLTNAHVNADGCVFRHLGFRLGKSAVLY